MKKKKKRIVLLLLIIISLVIIFLTITNNKNNNNENNTIKLDIILKENLKTEINNEIKISDFISKINTGKLVSKDTIIDTSKLGVKNIDIEILYNKLLYNYSFNIEIVDTTNPIIESKEELSTYIGKEIDLLKDISVNDNSKEDIKPTIEGIYDFNKVGTYNLKYVAIDSSNNKTTKEFILKVMEEPKTNNNNNSTNSKTSKGYEIKIINGVTYVDGVLIANKTYSLPSTFGNGLTKETITAFNNMKADASVIGLSLINSSGYRSYYDQKYIYNNYVKRDGQENADRYSARPGHSEHQTGLAFDLNSIDMSFDNTPESNWVKNNCFKYGLIIRYPKEKEYITGYMYEPWHLRYVGIELATKLYNKGNWITLEEYFGIDSVYK